MAYLFSYQYLKAFIVIVKEVRGGYFDLDNWKETYSVIPDLWKGILEKFNE